MKRVLSLSIVLFWLVMIGILIHRTVLVAPQPPSPSSSPPPSVQSQARVEEQEGWMGIYHQDRKIGYFHRRLSPTSDGYHWEEQSQMKLRVLDTDQTVQTAIRANIDQHYALKDFSFRLLSAGTIFRVDGEVTADGTKGQVLHGQITSGGDSSPFSFPLHEPLYLPTITQMTLRGVALQPGEERRYSIFNPLSMKPETISVTAIGPEALSVHGTTLTVTKVAERFGGTTVYAWLDHEGKVVKEEAKLGLILLRESQEDALGAGWQDGTPLDLVASASIPVRQVLPNPRALIRLQLKPSGPSDFSQFAFPPRQQVREGVITVARENVSALTTYQLPQTDPAFTTDLVATPFLQSTHPRLLAQAQQIIGPERDALKVTRQLLDWTYTTLAKEPTVGIPTALEALESKKGDCNEHAVLFTALARAIGLPARVAAGVVYLDGAFYYHAWAEVWLGQWVAIDPVFHQLPADATHIKFVQGGPEEHLALLKVIGQVGFEVAEYK